MKYKICVRLDVVYDTISTPLSIDVSTGDIITPNAVQYEFGGIFDDNVKITLQKQKEDLQE